jgi:penicillin amidase
MFHMLRQGLLLMLLTALAAPCSKAGDAVEIVRDRWGVSHIFAGREADGFFGAGYACAEDRLLQMEVLRRRARGRLSEILGEKFVDTDRKFRIAGIAQHARDAFEHLPREMQDDLRAYAAGVNAFIRKNPDRVRRRFAPLNILPEPWTPADTLAAWMSIADQFDHFFDENAVNSYRDFQAQVAKAGQAGALSFGRRILDDAAAIVSEAEMARDIEPYARLKAQKPIPGFAPEGTPMPEAHFSHAWAFGGARTTTGKPILESDPQVPVTNPPWWYEYHLAAGRFDVRGIGVAGCPAMLIGFNRRLAWGLTALGAGSTLTFLDKLSPDGRGYLYRGNIVPFQRRLERIDVKGGNPITQEVLTSPHGFVFNALVRESRAGEAYVSYYKETQDHGTSVRSMLERMMAANWKEFVASMESYYVPGAHVVYADVDGNLGYYTMVQVPLTKRSRRIALEGWTGEDEVLGRIPVDEMPHMLNPAENFISHANNLPVGSWYPFDLGVNSSGSGARAWRLRQILEGTRKYSVEDSERIVHRDDVQSGVAALLPIARKVAEQDRVQDEPVLRVLAAVRNWDLHYQSSSPAYPGAKALTSTIVTAFRRAMLGAKFGGADAGVCHLARVISEPFVNTGETPKDKRIRAYLIDWLRMAGSRDVDTQKPQGTLELPYEANERLEIPSLKKKLDLVSPRLSCDEIGTIWSQGGNSYTQIVDLSNIDNSRTVLPPGNSEDPESWAYASQMQIWVQGSTHAAPLSRSRVEAVAKAHTRLSPETYVGPDGPKDMTTRSEQGRFFPAIPPAAPKASSKTR